MSINPFTVWSAADLPTFNEPNTFNTKATNVINTLLPSFQAEYNVSTAQITTALNDSETVVDAVAGLQTTVADFPTQISSLQSNIDNNVMTNVSELTNDANYSTYTSNQSLNTDDDVIFQRITGDGSQLRDTNGVVGQAYITYFGNTPTIVYKTGLFNQITYANAVGNTAYLFNNQLPDTNYVVEITNQEQLGDDNRHFCSIYQGTKGVFGFTTRITSIHGGGLDVAQSVVVRRLGIL